MSFAEQMARADAGDANAAYVLAHYYMKGGVSECPQSYPAALKYLYFCLAANRAHSGALFELGSLYGQGLGVKKDFAESMRFYRAAAAAGHAHAMNEIGVAYQRGGQGVVRDYHETKRWFERAIDAGSVNALINLGLMYKHGQGVEQSNAHAIDLFRRGVEQGDSEAQRLLAEMYIDGCGVERCASEAARLLDAAKPVHDNAKKLHDMTLAHARKTFGAAEWERALVAAALAASRQVIAAAAHCVVCEEAPNSHAFVPCGHKACCGECSDKILGKKRKHDVDAAAPVCPLCRCAVTDALMIYESV